MEKKLDLIAFLFIFTEYQGKSNFGLHASEGTSFGIDFLMINCYELN